MEEPSLPIKAMLRAATVLSERSTNTVYQKSGSVNSDVMGLHWKVGVVYNPQVQGAIQTIHYSEDAILLEGFGEGQAAGLALRQNQQI